ncbi:energy transducer TonB [Propionivibrio dicarboxylicus]|uniref:Protein TonB n=1 Tax=Propionivibrio dicarboxylicus TaxID=83767 RepID=A0A1G7WJ28_9RHOO|nr:energy transducer TonB [Propionivibrio dicarboxylicus]SDG71809.1 protein TonB [Propionivibrio dicarboxylicus]
MPSRLLIAFALSFILHGVLLLPDVFKRLAAPSRPAALQATLRMPPVTPPPADTLLKNTLDESSEKARSEPTPPPPKASPPVKTSPPQKMPAKQNVQAAQRKLSQHLFYPPEAVARGIQGEVRLILRLSPSGTIEDVAVAASSGHAILDNAAIRAAYAMGQLAGGNGRELILPVIFRLQ